jgi:hypothetical protein
MGAPKSNRWTMLFKSDKKATPQAQPETQNEKEHQEIQEMTEKIKNLLRKDENGAKAAYILHTWLNPRKK